MWDGRLAQWIFIWLSNTPQIYTTQCLVYILVYGAGNLAPKIIRLSYVIELYHAEANATNLVG